MAATALLTRLAAPQNNTQPLRLSRSAAAREGNTDAGAVFPLPGELFVAKRVALVNVVARVR